MLVAAAAIAARAASFVIIQYRSLPDQGCIYARTAFFDGACNLMADSEIAAAEIEQAIAQMQLRAAHAASFHAHAHLAGAGFGDANGTEFKSPRGAEITHAAHCCHYMAFDGVRKKALLF